MKTYELKIDEKQRESLLESMYTMKNEWGLSDKEQDLYQMLFDMNSDVMNDLTA